MPAVINVVTIGGGSGQFVLLSGLKNIDNIAISAVVSMVDSGGSTGRLRDEFGVLPPGDILKCILALAPEQDAIRKLLQRRFRSHKQLNGHNVGNLLLSFLSQYTGDFPSGIKAMSELIDIKGTVLPVTISRATLVAELVDGTHVFGETAIDLPQEDQREKIRKTYLVPHYTEAVRVYPPVLEAINQADVIVIGPGDLYTSIIPNLIVPGVQEAIREAQAKLIYNVNIMTKFGETDHFQVSNFIEVLEEHLNRRVDIVTVNTQKPRKTLLKKYYDKEKAEFVVLDPTTESSPRQLIFRDLLYKSGNIIRHDSHKLAKTLHEQFTTPVDHACHL